MSENTKLKEMLINYASSHQHKINVLFHLIGIPTIMLGICIPLSWLNYEVFGQSFTAAHAVIFGLFLFYMTLDIAFSIVFLILGLLINQYAINLSLQSSAGTIAAIAFFGG